MNLALIEKLKSENISCNTIFTELQAKTFVVSPCPNSQNQPKSKTSEGAWLSQKPLGQPASIYVVFKFMSVLNFVVKC